MKISSQPNFIIKFPDGTKVTTGPGTVPTSTASVSKTSIQAIIRTSRIASKMGVFDTVEKSNNDFNR